MITYAPSDKPVLRPPVESAQYMSHDYRKLVVGYGMVQSVGRTGVCWDNSVAESAWSSLKRELVHPLPVRHPSRRTPGNLRLDQPLQLTPPFSGGSGTCRAMLHRGAV